MWGAVGAKGSIYLFFKVCELINNTGNMYYGECCYSLVHCHPVVGYYIAFVCHTLTNWIEV